MTYDQTYPEIPNDTLLNKVSPDSSLESQPLFRLGVWVQGLIDSAVGAAVAQFDRIMQRPAETFTVIAAVGLGCAALAWLLGALFSRANRPPRRESPPPVAPPAVVIQTGRATRVSRAGPVRRSAAPRPKRRQRRRRTNPILRWLGRE